MQCCLTLYVLYRLYHSYKMMTIWLQSHAKFFHVGYNIVIPCCTGCCPGLRLLAWCLHCFATACVAIAAGCAPVWPLPISSPKSVGCALIFGNKPLAQPPAARARARTASSASGHTRARQPASERSTSITGRYNMPVLHSKSGTSIYYVTVIYHPGPWLICSKLYTIGQVYY